MKHLHQRAGIGAPVRPQRSAPGSAPIPAGLEQDTATRLARIGYDNVVGYVADVAAYLERHADEVVPASRLRVDQLQHGRDGWLARDLPTT